MHPTLESCRTALRSARANLSPAEAEAVRGGWSAAGILEHLDLSYTGTTRALEVRLEKGRPLDARPVPMRQRLNRLFLLRLGGLFYRPREAPAAIVPTGRRFRELDAVIEPHLLVLDQRLKQAALAFGTRAAVAMHPFLGPLTVGDWRRFHRWHTSHHAQQLARSMVSR
jgi:DinB family protein